MVVAEPNGRTITLDRIADIKDEFSEEPSKAFINGDPAVIIAVEKFPEADALAISDAVRAYPIVAKAGWLRPKYGGKCEAVVL